MKRGSRWGSASWVAFLVLALGSGCSRLQGRAPHGDSGRVSRLERSRTAAHAYGRHGDLALHDGGTTVVFAAAPDAPGHRPMRGALVDATPVDADVADPLLALRTGWIDRNQKLHLLVASQVEETSCDAERDGVRVAGLVDGVSLDTRACPTGDGRITLTTTAHGLPAGASFGDEIGAGTAPVLSSSEASEGHEGETDFVAIAEHGTALLLEAKAMHVAQRYVHIASETFPAPLTTRYDGVVAVRTLHVLAGDLFHALARVPAVVPSAAGDRRKTIEARFADGRGGRVSIESDEIAPVPRMEGILTPGETRVLTLPPLPALGPTGALVFRDPTGVEAMRVPYLHVQDHGVLAVGAPALAHLTVDARGDDAEPLPVHVVLQALDGAPPPAPRTDGMIDVFAGGRSLYLAGGHANVGLAPGHYRVTVSHGPAFSLWTEDVRLEAGATRALRGTVRRVVDASAWTSADFHLHAAPSPDSPVSLAARVASLACEGVELAVATDHNRITDYAPFVSALGLGARLSTVRGDEVTSGGDVAWGHFNAFPLPLPSVDPEAQVPGYYGLSAAHMFDEAHAAGARVVQVNHGRMGGIGYFDLAGLDPRTGEAGPGFSGAFDAVEAYNGMWIEDPPRIRQGALDLVALARRGLHPAATGNSDSHQLLYNEAGYPRTYVRSEAHPIDTRADRALTTLRGGDTTVSSGPLVELVVDHTRPGSVLVPGGALGGSRQVHAHVRVFAPSWVPVEHVEVWRDDVVIARLEVPSAPRNAETDARGGLRFEADVDVPITADAVLLAWADADEPLPDVLPYPHARAIGFTGLVYVDADGDGKVVPPPGVAATGR